MSKLICNHAFHAALLEADVFPPHLPRKPPRLLHLRAVALFLSTLIWCFCCTHIANAASFSVSVDPSLGRDTPDCNLTQPCRTVAHAIVTRQAAHIILSRGVFFEPTIYIEGADSVIGIYGSRDKSVVDCSLRDSRDSGPAFAITDKRIAISGVTFQNCSNLNATTGLGGSIFTNSSNVSVSNCVFLNNAARSGGAIGALSGGLSVTSSVFENNTAACLNSTTCFTWGGAIFAADALFIHLKENNFSRNTVTLDLLSARDSGARAAGGGGCVSIFYSHNVTSSTVFIDENAFRQCTVKLTGYKSVDTASPSMQLGNTYGGAVSLYYGFRASATLHVRNSSVTFTSNLCLAALVTSSSARGGNSYGGCLSLYAGAWNANATDAATFVDNLSVSISRNTMLHCSSSIDAKEVGEGHASHGGGLSLAIGAYSHSLTSSVFLASTSVKNSAITISHNTIVNCTASSSTSTMSTASSVSSSSNGVHSHGGGISVAVGAYLYSKSYSDFYGDTSVSSSSYTIINNTLTNCNAKSSTTSHTSAYFYDFLAASFSNGSSAYGGGVSVVIGGCMYSQVGSGLETIAKQESSGIDRIRFKGDTSVTSSDFVISNNAITSCSALTFTSSSASSFPSLSSSSSNGVHAHGGGISVAVGAYLYSKSYSDFYGDTSVSSSSYTIINNTLTNCNAKSSTASSSAFASSLSSYTNGGSARGGCIAHAVGSFHYSESSSYFEGRTTVSSSTYRISDNALTNCNAATSLTSYSAFSSSTNGANSHGGGISVVFGSYHYSGFVSAFSGATFVSSSRLIVSSNSLNNCSAGVSTYCSSSTSCVSLSNGANVYGGCMSLAAGATHYSGSASTLIESTSISSSSYTIYNNNLSSCNVTSYTSSSYAVSSPFSSHSNGANAYGGGVFVGVGANHYSASTSISTGDTSFERSSCNISSNSFTSCFASSSLITFSALSSAVTSNGANVYGGAISLAVGTYSYVGSLSFINESTMVHSSSTTVSNNTLVRCAVASRVSTSSPISSSTSAFTDGTNAYGGGASLAVGAYSYSRSDIRGDAGLFTIALFDIDFRDFSCLFCTSDSFNSGVSSEALSFGGALAVIFESYTFPKRSTRATHPQVLASAVSMTRMSIANSTSSSCSAGESCASGGAVYVSVPHTDVSFSNVDIANSSVRTPCIASSSQTYSLGGCLSVIQARDVLINSSNFTHCLAVGSRQAINVFVSGGGVFIQDTQSVSLLGSLITTSRVEDAISTRVVACGGGAFGTNNVATVRISDSEFYNNWDSSSAGVVLLQHVNSVSSMLVSITNGSVIYTNPSLSTVLPALNISCGFNCSTKQQQRIHLLVSNSSIQAHHQSPQLYQSVTVMSLPKRMHTSASNSFVHCNFASPDNIAVLVFATSDRISVVCSPCTKPFTVALTSRSIDLSVLPSLVAQTETVDSCQPLMLQPPGITSQSEQHCPFGISSCSTIANVTVGLWTNFTVSGGIRETSICPSNYCGCRNIPGYSEPSCQLFPPFSADYRSEDALCNGNRTGVLCGGCKTNFTQSFNGFSCVRNDICEKTWPWVWTLTVIGYLFYAFYIVTTSMKVSRGFITCVLFYGQLSSFANAPSQLADTSNNSVFSTWLSQVSQFGSVLSLYDNSCYGLNMGAYEATAAQLCGPAVVLVAALVLTYAAQWLLPKWSPFLQKRKIEIRISFPATVINTLLLLFSSVSSVVFQLITCQRIGPDSVVFIDGTRACEGPLYMSLIAVAALLSVIPFIFWASLKFGKISAPAKSAVCSAYSHLRSDWVAISLIFRFIMTIIFATARQFPSVTAFALLICSMCMLILLMLLQPYAAKRTFYLDMFCYACLIAQFALQSLVRVSESLGIAVVATNNFRPALFAAARASAVLRYIPFVTCAAVILLDMARGWFNRHRKDNGRSVSGEEVERSGVELKSGNIDLASVLLL